MTFLGCGFFLVYGIGLALVVKWARYEAPDNFFVPLTCFIYTIFFSLFFYLFAAQERNALFTSVFRLNHLLTYDELAKNLSPEALLNRIESFFKRLTVAGRLLAYAVTGAMLTLVLLAQIRSPDAAPFLWELISFSFRGTLYGSILAIVLLVIAWSLTFFFFALILKKLNIAVLGEMPQPLPPEETHAESQPQ